MELRNGIKTFHAKNRESWRKWLMKNHGVETSVWLIIYKKDCAVPSIYYREAVDEALCFGWIDSKGNKRDENSYYQFFSRRNPKSNWSGVNKKKVASLIKEGLMTAAGMEMVKLAKKTGTWTALVDIEKLVMPDDLMALFAKNKTAFSFWGKFSPSTRRAILNWISEAKRPETRKKRITQTVKLAANNIKANAWTKK